MKQYKEMLQYILDSGTVKGDRTGTGTLSTFGYQTRFDLSEGFPLVTTKKMFTKGIIAELLWFLEGSTDERRLAEIQYGRRREHLIGQKTIWTDNADAQGKALGYENTDTVKELGPVYGKQWRKVPTFDYHEEVFFDDVPDDMEAYYGEPYTISDIDQIANLIHEIKNLVR